MKIEDFINKRPFLYHLTDVRNLELIKTNGLLLSTKSIVDKSRMDTNDKISFIRNRRQFHSTVEIDNQTYFIRDQKPISLTNLQKCLTNDWSTGDFLQHLNSRVFFWPTIARLERHYNRYQTEKPVIIKVSSRLLLELNPNADFCRLNSGATRSNSYLDGAPPKRGIETFLPADMYDNTVGSVAEVTFPNHCQLPTDFFTGGSPNGPWHHELLSI
jgi:hypothetical protein